mmetsp:Transcript_155/g.652  ORF Transcript_155/g.652 Transcript_155/m.652 type:complete len:158 (-) Transcript_155:4058-4531(-)
MRACGAVAIAGVAVAGAASSATRGRALYGRPRHFGHRRATHRDDVADDNERTWGEMTSTVRVRFIDGATGEMIHVRSRVGRNVLTLADEVGALDIDADDEFCLEGRCGTCSMEKINCDSGFTEDVILACRTCVEEGSDAAYRINRNVRLGDSTWMNG